MWRAAATGVTVEVSNVVVGGGKSGVASQAASRAWRSALLAAAI